MYRIYDETAKEYLTVEIGYGFGENKTIVKVVILFLSADDVGQFVAYINNNSKDPRHGHKLMLEVLVNHRT